MGTCYGAELVMLVAYFIRFGILVLIVLFIGLYTSGYRVSPVSLSVSRFRCFLSLNTVAFYTKFLVVIVLAAGDAMFYFF